jgi:transposase
VTGESVEIGYVDQGYTGDAAAQQAADDKIRLEAVNHKEATRGFLLLPRRWVIERTSGWLSRFRRLGRDYERLGVTLAGWHWLAFVSIVLARAFNSAQQALANCPRGSSTATGHDHVSLQA